MTHAVVSHLPVDGAQNDAPMAPACYCTVIMFIMVSLTPVVRMQLQSLCCSAAPRCGFYSTGVVSRASIGAPRSRTLRTSSCNLFRQLRPKAKGCGGWGLRPVGSNAQPPRIETHSTQFSTLLGLKIRPRCAPPPRGSSCLVCTKR